MQTSDLLNPGCSAPLPSGYVCWAAKCAGSITERASNLQTSWLTSECCELHKFQFQKSLDKKWGIYIHRDCACYMTRCTVRVEPSNKHIQFARVNRNHSLSSLWYLDPPWLSRSGMGWLRLVGSLKSYVSFAEYRLFYRALLPKRPIILRSLLIVATP